MSDKALSKSRMAHPRDKPEKLCTTKYTVWETKVKPGQGSFTSFNHPVQIEDRDVDALSRFYRNSTSAGGLGAHGQPPTVKGSAV
jgi:hypothetical protein